MKLPRWLVIGMLTSSVLAVLAAAGWWWVTWPERAAREFLDLVASGRTIEADRMASLDVVTLVEWSRPNAEDGLKWTDAGPRSLPRTLGDLALGQQGFDTNRLRSVGFNVQGLEVRRGRIVSIDV